MTIERMKVSSADLVIYERLSDLDLLYRMTPTDGVGNELLGKRAARRFSFIERGTMSLGAPWRIHRVNEFCLQSKTKLGDC